MSILSGEEKTRVRLDLHATCCVMWTAGGLECKAHGFPVSPASRMRLSREVTDASDTLPENLEHCCRVIVNGIASLDALVEGLRGKGIRLLSIDPCLAAPRQDRGEKLSRVWCTGNYLWCVLSQ